MDKQRRISYTQEQYEVLDDLVRRIRDTAMDAHMGKDRAAKLRTIITLTTALTKEMRDGVLE
jgi:hypothetical protein